jgi:hypothetical protein
MPVPNGPDAAGRRFGLADALILIAATAMSLGWLRNPGPELSLVRERGLIGNLEPAALIGSAFAATWGGAVLALRLSRPRSGSGPGFIAIIAAQAGCLLGLAVALLRHATRHFGQAPLRSSILGHIIGPSAMTVLGAWLTLYLVGMWQRERTWLDDLGIALGISWIVMYAMLVIAACLA